jgi:predicted dehydrogenase
LLVEQQVRVAVVGAGAFGGNHLRVYRELEKAGYPVVLAAVVDSNRALASKASQDWNIPSYESVDQLAGA